MKTLQQHKEEIVKTVEQELKLLLAEMPDESREANVMEAVEQALTIIKNKMKNND